MPSNDRNPGIVGGVFGLPLSAPAEVSLPDFLRGRSRFLVNGRSCLNVLLRRLGTCKLWMPSYLCGSILEGVPKQVDVKFYELDLNLELTSDRFFRRIKPRDVVGVINYFGISANERIAKLAKERGAIVIEDACQAHRPGIDTALADFAIFSLRKLVGVPDGAILQIRGQDIFSGKLKLQKPSSQWWDDARQACSLRAAFDKGQGSSQPWFELFQRAEANQPTGAFAMTAFSRKLMKTAFDWENIATKRVKNYLYLASKLSDVALFKGLPNGAVPLGFPIRTKDRDRVRQFLFKHLIFPPIHWPIAGVTPKRFAQSHQLADEILTLPCDQRYDMQVMKRVARLTRQALDQ
jgi:hypothetical protein